MKRILTGGLALLWALALLAAAAPGALAAEEASLTVSYVREDGPVSGAAFSLWRIGDISDSGGVRLSGDFAAYPVVLDSDGGNWPDMARTLAAYAWADGLAPAAEGVTEDGTLVFNGLTAGLYLAVGQVTEAGGWVYTPAPVLVCLPGLDERDQPLYDVTAVVKYEKSAAGPLALGALKLWEGDGARPQAVTVQLLRDGEVYDTVTLDSANGWRYVWDGLEPNHLWLVAEKDVPENYTVSVSAAGSWFTVTNTTHEDTPEPPEPPGGDETLPQTGQLWWPVPPLALAGVALFAAGWFLCRGGKDEET